MSKRGWIWVSIAAGSFAGLAGTIAGVAAYIHRARRKATTTAREAFDPYYGMIQHLQSLDQSGPELDGA